ncbi:twin-arginine translocase subunit TatC [Alkalihalobacillus deserti]|uniref:twin-arginine translocase subunit TatC n=1 Tax=Alkalihalobacillus deserti TaxID=2879466 RepID=UPI001D14859F|nr:twin-arginine translocase subunit TatC [Alkalihalobacillus deserti]
MDTTGMQLEGHLEELRKRIIFVLVTFLILMCIGFVFVEEIYNWIIKAADQPLTILGPSDILWIYFVLAGSFAIIATTPIALFQIWKFIKPAISKEEQKTVVFFLPSILICFIVGISFGYFVLFPSVFAFLNTLATDQLITMYTAEKYFKFLLNLTLPIGFLFEMPIVIMLLTRLGILNPFMLAKTRKVAYVILTVVATLVTPPDFISAIIVMAPLILLYELSISISKVVYKKRLVLLKEAS